MRWSKFNRLSAYARADNHLTQQTSYGAVGMYTLPAEPACCMRVRTQFVYAVTLCGACLAILLLFSEIGRYRSAHGVTTVCQCLAAPHLTLTLLMLSADFAMQMGVDTSRGEHLRITLDVTLPALPCAGAHPPKLNFNAYVLTLQ